MTEISILQKKITACTACDRLRSYCLKVAKEKRRAYQDQAYWGKPITGFGDPNSKVMIVGLAPAAHGANRTGRVFTGDRSGDWLYRALYKSGFANQPHATDIHDRLQLKEAYISCVVKCAPPENKPTTEEEKNCSPFLKEEIESLPSVKIWIALGQIALKGLWPLLHPQGKPRPRFQHGSVIPLDADRWLLLSYHPSQQNTFTGRLTEPMFDQVFSRAREILGKS